MLTPKRIMALTLCLALTNIQATSLTHRAYAEEIPQAAQTEPKVIAIADFSNNTGDPSMDYLRQGLANTVITNLANFPELTVVERSRFEAVVKELGLSSSGMIDASSAAKLGGALGASQIIVGEIIRAGSRMRINVRLLDVKTVKVILSASKDGNSQEDILRLIDHVSADIAIRMGVNPTLVAKNLMDLPSSPATPSPQPVPTIAPTPAPVANEGVSPWVWVGLGAGVIALVGGVVYFVMKNNQQQQVQQPILQRPDRTVIINPQPTVQPQPQPTIQPQPQPTLQPVKQPLPGPTPVPGPTPRPGPTPVPGPTVQPRIL